MDTHDTAVRFARSVAERPGLQHAAVRVGLWLVEAAERTGGFPVEMYNTEFIYGLKRSGEVVLPGVAYRPETVAKSLKSLETEGLLTVAEGKNRSKLFTLTPD